MAEVGHGMGHGDRRSEWVVVWLKWVTEIGVVTARSMFLGFYCKVGFLLASPMLLGFCCDIGFIYLFIF